MGHLEPLLKLSKNHSSVTSLNLLSEQPHRLSSLIHRDLEAASFRGSLKVIFFHGDGARIELNVLICGCFSFSII